MEHKIAEARTRLEDSGIETGRLDVELLLASVLKTNRAGLLARRRDPLTPEQEAAFDELVERRAKYEPIAYILGVKEFYGREFAVTPDVLIPRPETEQLIDLIKKHVKTLLSEGQRIFLADVGCGSGAIGITLASELNCAVTLSDISDAALEVARRNAQQLGVGEQVQIKQSDLLAFIKDVDLDLYDQVIIAANLPYVADAANLPPDVKDYEPALALFSGTLGHDLIFKAITQAVEFRPKIRLFLEHGHGSRIAIKQFAQSHGFATKEYDDLAGFERNIELY